MLNKNAVIILKCIMDRDKCDMISAIKFAEHNQTCYDIAMAVAQAKSVQLETEKEALINKACEWLEHNVWKYTGFDSYELSEAFKNAMKGE